jgi:hypothetical protein
MTNKTMNPQRSEDLKQTLRDLAAKQKVDLTSQVNKWTLWSRPTARNFPDSLPAKHYRFEFMAGGASLARLFERVEQDHSYMMDLIDGALILEARGADEFIIREVSCSQG